MSSVFLKVCCILSEAEAELAIAAGAAALGLVSKMPSGPGVIDEDTIASVVRAVGGRAETVLLTSETTSSAIAAQHARTGASAIQLVDEVAQAELAALRHALPRVRVVQVVHVEGPAAVGRAIAAAPLVDALLLDSGVPGAAVPTLGGTGNTHDWSVSAEVCRAVRVPVFLAGGLRPDNVVEAVAKVRPAGVDVCSGLRTNGALDPAKLGAFVRALTLRSGPFTRSIGA